MDSNRSRPCCPAGGGTGGVSAPFSGAGVDPQPARRGIQEGFHISLTPLEGVEPWEMRTRCGWRYGTSRWVTLDAAPPEPRDFYVVCKRCAPKARSELFREFAASTGVREEKLRR